MAAVSVYDLGCFYCPQPAVPLNMVAAVGGTYTASFTYAGTEVRIQWEQVDGQPINVPIGELGAPYVYRFHVELPDTTWLIYNDGTTDFNCFQLCLKVALVGEPVFLDLSVVSCENLNDDELGLTQEQILECLIPTLDFADDPTFDALTDAQEAQLVSRLCGSTAPVKLKTTDGSLELASLPPGTIYPLKAVKLRSQDTTLWALVPIIDMTGDGGTGYEIGVTFGPAPIRDTDGNPIAGVSDVGLSQITGPSTITIPDARVEDQDGNLIGFVHPGATLVVNISTEVPAFITYDTEVAALADTTTIPSKIQNVKVLDTGRQYQGDNASTVSVLVTAKTYLPAVTEDPTTGLHTTFDGADALIQLN